MVSTSKYLTLAEMAERLECSTKTLAREVKTKQIPYITIGRRKRFDAAKVELYVCADMSANCPKSKKIN